MATSFFPNASIQRGRQKDIWHPLTHSHTGSAWRKGHYVTLVLSSRHTRADGCHHNAELNARQPCSPVYVEQVSGLPHVDLSGRQPLEHPQVTQRELQEILELVPESARVKHQRAQQESEGSVPLRSQKASELRGRQHVRGKLLAGHATGKQQKAPASQIPHLFHALQLRMHLRQHAG